MTDAATSIDSGPMTKRSLVTIWSAQPERTRDDKDRANAHGGGGDHRVKQKAAEGVKHAGRDRHREDVEDEHEEQLC